MGKDMILVNAGIQASLGVSWRNNKDIVNMYIQASAGFKCKEPERSWCGDFAYWVLKESGITPLPGLAKPAKGGWDTVSRAEKVVAYQKGGSWFGMRSFAQRTPLGVNWAIAMNASLQPDAFDAKVFQDAIREVRETLEKHKVFPTEDMFGDFK